MAKLVLTIQPKDEGALKSVQALKAEVQSLSKSLSSIKITSSGVETTRKGYANLITTLKTLKSQYADGVFGNLPQDAERAFKKIQEISAALQESGKLTKEQAKAYAQLSQQLKKFSADLATVKAKNDKIVAANPFTVTQAQQIPRLIKQYSTLLNHIKSIEKYYPKGTFDTFKADLTEGTTQLQGLNQEYQTTQTLTQDSQAQLNGLADGFLQVNAAIAQTTSTMKSSKGSLIDIVTGFAKFQLSAMLVMKPLQMIRSALSSINETLVKTEDAVIALQRVLPTGSATDDEISGKVYDIAERYGQTFENVSQIATNFARTGMSWADTIKATEAAVLALNVAELDAEEATTGLIAILSQFNLEASDLETVIDKLNKTADNFPVTTEKILAALQRTGSAASNANLTLDQTIALITALSKATGRSGENIGTALNSLIQYSSKSSALDTFAGLSEQSAAVVERFRQGGANILDVWRQVSEEIKSLKSDQADLLDQYFATEDGEALKDALDGELQDIYTELGGVYDTANTFRKNYFIALLGNMDTVEQAMGTLGDAVGYSQSENEKYLKTYTARLNSLKAQWEDIANSEQGILGIKKALVDVGSVLLTIIKWTGGLRTVLLAISTVVWALVGNKIIAGFKAIGTALKGLVTGFRTATTAAQGFQAALGAIGAIATVISLIVGVIQQANEEAQRLDSKAITRASEGLSTLRDNVQQNIDRFDELKRAVEEARAILADSTSTTEEVASAQNTLTTIQDTLTKSNLAYADSLDLTNGELAKQLDLIAQMGEENARKKVQEYLDTNADAIYEARQFKQQKFDRITFSEAVGMWNGNDVPLQDWLNELGYESYSDAGLWEVFGSFFSNSQVLKTVLETNGLTRDEQIAFLEELFEKARYEENADYLQAQIREAINAIKNDQTYQDVENLLSGSDNTWGAPIEVLERFVNSNDPDAYERFLKEIGLLQEDVTTEAGEWHNNIAKVTGKYDDLIDKLKELRDAEKESLELEERKQAVLEAQKALEQAQNEATVRRFNEATGQWEWQTDEKAIAEAEKDLENARDDLEEQAYKSIIDQLEDKTATNEGLNDLLDGLKAYLGEEFIRGIKDAILGSTGVDLDKPINEGGKAEAGGAQKWKSYEDAANAGFANIKTAREFNRGGRDKEQYGDYQSYLNAMYDKYMGGGTYDRGGVALGKGVMVKATERPETMLGPDLTEKILSPVSSERFHQFTRDLGLQFETQRNFQPRPIVEHIGGATDNSVNNSGQIIMNGVTIGSDRRASPLDETLALGGIVSNA